MEMTLSLCANCENAPGCTLRNGHPVMQCEEHKVTEWKTVKNGFDLNHRVSRQPIVLKHFKGLCGTCDFKNNCKWVDPATVVFHCEHYL